MNTGQEDLLWFLVVRIVGKLERARLEAAFDRLMMCSSLCHLYSTMLLSVVLAGRIREALTIWARVVNVVPVMLFAWHG